MCARLHTQKLLTFYSCVEIQGQAILIFKKSDTLVIEYSETLWTRTVISLIPEVSPGSKHSRSVAQRVHIQRVASVSLAKFNPDRSWIYQILLPFNVQVSDECRSWLWTLLHKSTQSAAYFQHVLCQSVA